MEKQVSTKKALITGITGQDGKHLTELLLSKGYQVYGIVNGQREMAGELFGLEFPDVVQIKGDLTDLSSLAHALEQVKPDEIYNLGAISFVGMSFRQPECYRPWGIAPFRCDKISWFGKNRSNLPSI